jgi:hypothetical protein
MICSTSGEEVAEGSSQKVKREIPTMCMEYQNPIQKQHKQNTKLSNLKQTCFSVAPKTFRLDWIGQCGEETIRESVLVTEHLLTIILLRKLRKPSRCDVQQTNLLLVSHIIAVFEWRKELPLGWVSCRYLESGSSATNLRKWEVGNEKPLPP